MLQAWMGQRLQQMADKAILQAVWNEDFNNSRQSNASGLDRTKTSTIADKAMLHSWMEQRLQQWQTKQCFSPGWNEDFNNSRHKKPAEKSTVQA